MESKNLSKDFHSFLEEHDEGEDRDLRETILKPAALKLAKQLEYYDRISAVSLLILAISALIALIAAALTVSSTLTWIAGAVPILCSIAFACSKRWRHQVIANLSKKSAFLTLFDTQYHALLTAYLESFTSSERKLLDDDEHLITRECTDHSIWLFAALGNDLASSVKAVLEDRFTLPLHVSESLNHDYKSRSESIEEKPQLEPDCTYFVPWIAEVPKQDIEPLLSEAIELGICTIDDKQIVEDMFTVAMTKRFHDQEDFNKAVVAKVHKTRSDLTKDRIKRIASNTLKSKTYSRCRQFMTDSAYRSRIRDARNTGQYRMNLPN